MIRRAVCALWRIVEIKRDPVRYARKCGAIIGEDVRLLGLDGRTFGSEPYLVTIGNHVTITVQTRFITHDGGVWVFREERPNIELCQPIVIGDNVFVGFRLIILTGVTIGNNVVIGAGSVVTRDIPDCSVAAGIPARVICSLEEYWEKIEPKFFTCEWKTDEEKRHFLTRTFSDSDFGGNRKSRKSKC